MIGALLYLRLKSLRNLVVQRVRRLRQPKYLLGTAVAAAYFYFFFFRRTATFGAPSVAGGRAGAAMGSVAIAFICAGVCLVMLIRIAFAWISPAEKPGLRFTEAEIGFLFPAPISRRSLIHYRLLSSQLTILFTSVLIAVVFNRPGYIGGNRLIHAIGWWVILSISDLHLNGTNLTLSQLRANRSTFLLWRIGIVTAIVLYAVELVRLAIGPVNAYLSNRALLQGAPGVSIGRVLDTGAIHWLTLPFRIVFGPYFANNMSEFGVAMVPALLLLGLHYYWVSSTEARFEEGSIALAEKRAAIRAAALRGEMPKLGNSRPAARSGPFPLHPVGLPEFAFLWKNLLSMRNSLFSRRALFIVLAVLVWMAFSLGPMLSRRSGSQAAGPLIVILCAMVAAYTVVLGPQVARQDLRSDLPNMDVLKTYPLAGWRLALGELLAPTLLLTLVLWTTIVAAAAAVDARGSIEWLTSSVRVTVAVCLGTAAPFLCLIQLIVPNSIMMLLPGWYQASRSRAGGIEMFGQRLIFGVMQMFFALLVIVPAAGWMALVIFAAHNALGIGPAIVLGTLTVQFILGAEAAVGLWWLGERFEKFDLSTDSK